MIEIAPNLFIGTEYDYESTVKRQSRWYVVHACKEPYHRQLLGYTGRGAPKDHPEYLIARRGSRLFLNLVDVEDPSYVSKEIIDTALSFIDEALAAGAHCLVHCNQGESRSPSIGLLYLATKGTIHNLTLSEAEEDFRKIYPSYNPKAGIRGFLQIHWSEYIK